MEKAYNKTEAQFFLDWEKAVFGYGYGTGEQHTIKALKDFLSSFDKSYNYEELEQKLGFEITWLLINILAKDDVLEYGSSPRFAWLTSKGELLQNFVKEHTLVQLYDSVMKDDEYEKSGFSYCDYSVCNCYPNQLNGVCRNNPYLNEKVADDMKYKK